MGIGHYFVCFFHQTFLVAMTIQTGPIGRTFLRRVLLMAGVAFESLSLMFIDKEGISLSSNMHAE
jgi:hypothetical protein